LPECRAGRIIFPPSRIGGARISVDAVMPPIPDFTAGEQRDVAALLQRRYGTSVGIELAESELLLDPAQGRMTACPTLYWSQRGAHFVVFRTAAHRYRCQFFYTDADHYGTGRDEYDDLEACVLTLLQVQADHERESARASSGATAAELGAEEYHGPAIL
jgi:hypothetical protein